MPILFNCNIHLVSSGKTGSVGHHIILIQSDPLSQNLCSGHNEKKALCNSSGEYTATSIKHQANHMIRLASMFVLGVQKGSEDVRYINIFVLKSRFRIYSGAGTNVKFSKNHFSTQKAGTNQS